MIDGKAYTEVFYIINSMPVGMREKIPLNIRKNIESKMDKNYKFSIDKNIKTMSLLADTEKLLSVLYTDYFATNEERIIIKKKEKSEYEKLENLKRKQYDLNVFKKNTIQNENQSLEIVPQNNSIIAKILRKIKKIIKTLYKE